jgi:uncharacterized protein (DUF4415 family)
VPEKQKKQNGKRTIVRFTLTKGYQGKTNRNRFNKLSDAEIQKGIDSDPDAAPLLDTEWFRTAKLVMPEPKKAVSIRLDRDVTEWFQRQGKGYQTRINAVLRAYVNAQR